jgi:lauroyl/myristoyl acyltransferase
VKEYSAMMRRQFAERLGNLIGDSRRRLCPGESQLVRENLIRLGLVDSSDPAVVDPLVGATFRAFGLFFSEFWAGLGHSPDRIRAGWELEGFEHLARLNRSGRGWILVGAHTGNWEQLGLLGPLLNRKLVAPAGVQFHPLLSPLVKWLKQRRGIESLAPESSPRRLLRALGNGALVALPLDGGSFRQGKVVPLCDGRWRMATGAAELSVISGVPIVPVFSKRTGFMTQRVRIQPPIYPDRENREAAVEQMLEKLSGLLGDHLRDCRGQWCIFRALEAADSGCGT